MTDIIRIQCAEHELHYWREEGPKTTVIFVAPARADAMNPTRGTATDVDPDLDPQSLERAVCRWWQRNSGLR